MKRKETRQERNNTCEGHARKLCCFWGRGGKGVGGNPILKAAIRILQRAESQTGLSFKSSLETKQSRPFSRDCIQARIMLSSMLL